MLKKLEEAISSGDSKEASKINAELAKKAAKSERQLKLAVEQLTELSKENGKMMDEKMLSDIENSRRAKIYDTVMKDNSLKEIVALRNKAQSDDSAKGDLEEALKGFYESVSGVSISELVEQKRKSEKEAMSQAN